MSESDSDCDSNESSPLDETDRKNALLRDFRVGDTFQALDCVSKWCTVNAMEVNAQRKQVKVHYVGWASKWDEWIPMDSPRIIGLYEQPPIKKPESSSNIINSDTMSPVSRLVLSRASKQL